MDLRSRWSCHYPLRRYGTRCVNLRPSLWNHLHPLSESPTIGALKIQRWVRIASAISNTSILPDNFETLDTLGSRLFLPPSLSSFGQAPLPGCTESRARQQCLHPQPRFIAQNTFMYTTISSNTIHLQDNPLSSIQPLPQILRLTNYPF